MNLKVRDRTDEELFAREKVDGWDSWGNEVWNYQVIHMSGRPLEKSII